jgi:hypothetical protein
MKPTRILTPKRQTILPRPLARYLRARILADPSLALQLRRFQQAAGLRRNPPLFNE